MSNKTKHLANRLVICSALALCLSAQAIAQDKTTPTDGLNLNIPATGVGFEGLSVDLDTIIDLPAESVGSTLFKLDLGDTNCLTGGEGCLSRSETLNLGYDTALSLIHI